jgi:hypothetical protein
MILKVVAKTAGEVCGYNFSEATGLEVIKLDLDIILP